jgi:hypothetical protein
LVIHEPYALPALRGLKREDLDQSEAMLRLFRSKKFLSRLLQCRQRVKFGRDRKKMTAKVVPPDRRSFANGRKLLRALPLVSERRPQGHSVHDRPVDHEAGRNFPEWKKTFRAGGISDSTRTEHCA